MAERFFHQNYRKRDPDNADEEEFMENLFDTLCSALLEPEIKQLFHDAEGVDLMLIMMKCVPMFLLVLLVYLPPRVLAMQRKTLSPRSCYKGA